MKKTTLSVLILISLILLVPINQVIAGTYKVGTITISNNNSIVIEPGESATFDITVIRPSKTPSTSGAFDATLVIIGNLPEGAIATFKPAVLTFGSKDSIKEAILTITTDSKTIAGTYQFSVQAIRNEAPLDFEPSAIVTLIIDNAPVLAAIGDKTVDELTSLEFGAFATDSDLPPQTLTFSLVSAPAGASIDSSTGVFAWTPNEKQDGKYKFDVVVSDGILLDSETITVTVNEVNVAPTLDPISILVTEVAVNEPLTFTATASDDDYVLGVKNTLTFSLVSAPAGASIDSSTGVFAWTPNVDQFSNVFAFDLVVSDGALTDSQTITFDVKYNVKIGPGVSVPVDPDVKLTFGYVNERGIATADSSTEPPKGFYPLLGIIGEYYDITVNSLFFDTSQGVVVAIHYDDTGLTKKQESNLRLFTSDGKPVEGDFNGDGIVDVKDQTLLTNAIIDPNGTPYIYQYDIDGSGSLNQNDLAYFKANCLGNSAWTDITSGIDTVSNIIYGITDHFSGFGVR